MQSNKRKKSSFTLILRKAFKLESKKAFTLIPGQRSGKASIRYGFTLIEVIIDAFVITVVFGALVSSFIMVLKTVNTGRIREVAASLANEQMETLRNLPYDSLATQHGTIIPQGSIPDTQTVSRSGDNFILSSTIIFIDDPFDGCAIPAGSNVYQCTDGATSAQQDLAPIDYKRITLGVAQATNPTLMLASLTSNVSAKAAETPSNTGMLLTTVDDAQGQPISDATVTVTDTAKSISTQGLTNGQGYVFIAGLPPDTTNGYHIVVTKSGYSTDQTYTRDISNPNQFQPDVLVNAQQITTETLSIDTLSAMTISLVNEQDQPVSGVQLTATSSKISNNSPLTPKNTYKQTSDASGSVTFSSIEWDSYTITAPAGYLVISTSPYQPVNVAPTTTANALMAVSTNLGYPAITGANPTTTATNTTTTFTVDGSNFQSGATVLLRLSGQADILPTSTVVDPAQKLITVTFDLTSAVPGNWDMVITSGGNTVTQKNGVTIQ